MHNIMSWVEAHPVLFNTVLWPLVSAIALLLFKPRTPDEYARMNPRVAGFLIFLSGLGLDIPKALEGLRRVLTGKAIPVDAARARDLLETAVVVPKKPIADDSLPPPTTMGPPGAAALLIIAAFAHSQVACSGDSAQRAADNAQRVVNATRAEEYGRALDACVVLGKREKSLDIFESCAQDADRKYGRDAGAREGGF